MCLSVPRRISTLLHGSVCNVVEWQGVSFSCALMGGFAICGCTGFVAMTAQRRTRNVSECLYSLYAWLVVCSCASCLALFGFLFDTCTNMACTYMSSVVCVQQLTAWNSTQDFVYPYLLDNYLNYFLPLDCSNVPLTPPAPVSPPRSYAAECQSNLFTQNWFVQRASWRMKSCLLYACCRMCILVMLHHAFLGSVLCLLFVMPLCCQQMTLFFA